MIFVQTVARRMICRKLVRQMLLSRTKIKKSSVEKNRLALSIAIADSKKLRFPLPELDKAIILLDRLEAAEKLREEMKECPCWADLRCAEEKGDEFAQARESRY